MSGYFGDSGNNDVNFMQNWNKGMEEHYIPFRNENKVELMGFLMSDIMGIQGAIVNGVEISITMIPNTDNIHLQSFKNNTYGRIVIDDIYMYTCKRQFSKEVILAHANLMQTTEVKLELIMVIKEIRKSSLKILMNQKYQLGSYWV